MQMVTANSRDQSKHFMKQAH